MQGWLGNHYLGYDWSMPTISAADPLPGMVANTDPDLYVYVGRRQFSNFERQGQLFFHEMAHMPQWTGGSLTVPGYFASAIWHGGVHDNIPVEIEAGNVGNFLNDAYIDEGKPCD